MGAPVQEVAMGHITDTDWGPCHEVFGSMQNVTDQPQRTRSWHEAHRTSKGRSGASRGVWCRPSMTAALATGASDNKPRRVPAQRWVGAGVSTGDRTSLSHLSNHKGQGCSPASVSPVLPSRPSSTWHEPLILEGQSPLQTSACGMRPIEICGFKEYQT